MIWFYYNHHPRSIDQHREILQLLNATYNFKPIVLLASWTPKTILLLIIHFSPLIAKPTIYFNRKMSPKTQMPFILVLTLFQLDAYLTFG